ncbi:MAG: alpha/beta fold hydrolase [Betaproteobacteria bacterium]|nr:alpha/beta fold hydrolase [Betaproteobacteria bacterium]
MPYARVNGIDLYFESHGDGPAVVFLHGRGGNHLSWYQQVAAFRDRYRCIAIDHREFGLSRETPGGPGRRAFVDDLRELLEHLDVRRACLVGQSMGGFTALGYALRHAERVSGVVLSDTSGGINDERILAAFRQRLPSLPTDVAIRALSAEFRARDPVQAFLYAEIGRLAPTVRESLEGLLTSEDGPGAGDLKDYAVPTLVIVGELDIVVPPEVARLVAACLAGARLAVVPGAGHSVYFEKPAEFNRLLGEFLAALPDG